MAYGILSAFPMLVCLFWTFTLALGIGQGGPARRMLTVWMGTATVLYLCHWVYFNRAYAALSVTDTIYALCTLSVYPLYFLYIKLLTENRYKVADEARFLQDVLSVISTFLGFVPSSGPTTPASHNWSIILAARLNPIRNTRCNRPMDALSFSMMNRPTSSK